VIPPQEVSGASVKYIRIPSMEGYVRLSTIHSHPSFSASHSDVDVSDEKDSDGLHITVGKIKNPIFEIVASIVVGGTRFKVEPQNYIAGIQKVQEEVQKPEIMIYGNLWYKYNMKDISLFTQSSYEEGYRFIKWSKKFERYNPNWVDSVKPAKQEIATFDYEKWSEELGTFDERITTFRDILPEPGDIKQERRVVKEFNPCGTCAFKSFKLTEEKKLIGESHGI
jgi:hypothetical protein